jgi:branched-chain amino acid aminotransferase
VSEWINVNGVITTPQSAVVPALDRGFLYGDAVYETIRTYGGRPFRLPQHLDRLRRSADALEIPHARSPVDPHDEVMKTLLRAKNEECAVRVVLSRGPAPIGYDPTLAGPPTLVVYVRPYPAIPDSWLREGVDVTIVDVQRNSDMALNPAIKSNNLLNNFLACMEAFRMAAYEPILPNARGQLTEGASSNIFIVRDGRLLTPDLGAGILEGITRGFVLDLARHDGMKVAEEAVLPDELRRADEAFLTSTLKGILPVRRCDGWPIRDGRPGPLTRRLIRLFEAAVQEETNAGSPPGSIRR